MGARGDGVADVDGVPWFIPFALPGESVLATAIAPRGDGVFAEIQSIESPSPERQAAACRHFGRCGGCDLQHASPATYVAYKRDRVVAALGRRGLVADAITAPEPARPGQRRRLALAALRVAEGALVGLHQQGTNRIEALQECPVAHPDLVGLLAPLSAFLGVWLAPGAKADILATVTDVGLDLLVDGPPPPNDARAAAGDFMAACGAARLSWRPNPAAAAETMIELSKPTITLTGRVAPMPPGGFLQATPDGEAAIVAAVRSAVGAPASRSGARLADLFSGFGTLSLPLAQDGWKVLAVERDATAIAALLKASHGPGPRLPIDAAARDLDDRPFAEDELTPFAAVVFDPPRAGAKAQATMLARSAVPVVAAVSCNPETFARDARILVDGGYRLGRITVIDQFLWSHHVELVADFRRT